MFEKRSSIGQQAIRLRALAEIRLNIHLEVYKGASFNSKELLMHRIQEYAEHLGLRFTTPKNKNTHRFVEVTPFIPKKKDSDTSESDFNISESDFNIAARYSEESHKWIIEKYSVREDILPIKPQSGSIKTSYPLDKLASCMEGHLEADPFTPSHLLKPCFKKNCSVL